MAKWTLIYKSMSEGEAKRLVEALRSKLSGVSEDEEIEVQRNAYIPDGATYLVNEDYIYTEPMTPFASPPEKYNYALEWRELTDSEQAAEDTTWD